MWCQSILAKLCRLIKCFVTLDFFNTKVWELTFFFNFFNNASIFNLLGVNFLCGNFCKYSHLKHNFPAFFALSVWTNPGSLFALSLSISFSIWLALNSLATGLQIILRASVPQMPFTSTLQTNLRQEEALIFLFCWLFPWNWGYFICLLQESFPPKEYKKSLIKKYIQVTCFWFNQRKTFSFKW